MQIFAAHPLMQGVIQSKIKGWCRQCLRHWKFGKIRKKKRNDETTIGIGKDI